MKSFIPTSAKHLKMTLEFTVYCLMSLENESKIIIEIKPLLNWAEKVLKEDVEKFHENKR